MGSVLAAFRRFLSLFGDGGLKTIRRITAYGLEAPIMATVMRNWAREYCGLWQKDIWSRALITTTAFADANAADRLFQIIRTVQFGCMAKSIISLIVSGGNLWSCGKFSAPETSLGMQTDLASLRRVRLQPIVRCSCRCGMCSEWLNYLRCLRCAELWSIELVCT